MLVCEAAGTSALLLSPTHFRRPPYVFFPFDSAVVAVVAAAVGIDVVVSVVAEVVAGDVVVAVAVVVAAGCCLWYSICDPLWFPFVHSFVSCFDLLGHRCVLWRRGRCSLWKDNNLN